MELPAALRAAVDEALEGVALADLQRAGATLSTRYRAETRDGRFHINDELTAKVYLAARLPATFAAIAAAMAQLGEVHGSFSPRTQIDIGSGPGSAAWAAAEQWPSLAAVDLVEGSGAIRRWGERLAQRLPMPVRWHDADVTTKLPDLAAADLVTLAYVLDELAPDQRTALVDRLWTLTRDTLLIVEPGTPAGWERILAARRQLLAAGAHMVAPCPHHLACPLVPPDWCHFAQRVARSRMHRLSKGGEVPWEDEKFIYLAVSRTPVTRPEARVIAPPQQASGQVALKLCQADGTAVLTRLSKRHGEAYKRARRSDWGDAL